MSSRRGEPLPGDLYSQKVRKLDHLADGLSAVMVTYLEQAGQEAGLATLTWTVRFESSVSGGTVIENSCVIEGWCEAEGAEGVALCQQWVATADNLNSIWDKPVIDGAGIWTASGYLGGVDLSVACVIDPEARERALQLREDEKDHWDEWFPPETRSPAAAPPTPAGSGTP